MRSLALSCVRHCRAARDPVSLTLPWMGFAVLGNRRASQELTTTGLTVSCIFGFDKFLPGFFAMAIFAPELVPASALAAAPLAALVADLAAALAAVLAATIDAGALYQFSCRAN